MPKERSSRQTPSIYVCMHKDCVGSFPMSKQGEVRKHIRTKHGIFSNGVKMNNLSIRHKNATALEIEDDKKTKEKYYRLYTGEKTNVNSIPTKCYEEAIVYVPQQSVIPAPPIRAPGNLVPSHLGTAVQDIPVEEMQVLLRVKEILTDDIKKYNKKSTGSLIDHTPDVQMNLLAPKLRVLLSMLCTNDYQEDKYQKNERYIMDGNVNDKNVTGIRNKLISRNNAVDTITGQIMNLAKQQGSMSNQKKTNTIALQAYNTPNIVINMLRAIGFCAHTSNTTHKFIESEDAIKYEKGKLTLIGIINFLF